MDYVEMIKDPELVLGFQELICDSDPVVVKRTIKVFTSVYHHTLRLLSNGELEEETLSKSWTSVKGVVDTLLTMVKRCENEGILVHLLRFLEAAVMSHLMYDLSNFPLVFERGRDVVKTGLKALKDLVTLPYVGGSAFIVGIRALISIACLRPDLWEPVTDLLKKQLASLPPTLFDHNVRSLNKTLQRNLFRLLRRAESPELKGKLIEMMVSVGVPRKVIMPWAPYGAGGRKRSPPGPLSDNVYLGRVSPPQKRARTEPETNGDENKNSKKITPEPPVDPRLAAPSDSRPSDPRKATQPKMTVSENPPANKTNADLMFLTSLIPTGKIAESKQKKELSSLEKELLKSVNLNKVCTLVIQHINNIPKDEPKGFQDAFMSVGNVRDSSEVLRQRIASLLTNYFNEHNISSLSQPLDSKPHSPRPPPSESIRNEPTESNSATPDMNIVQSNSNSASSTPSSTPPLMDTDLRQVYSRPNVSMGDVDMRIADPRLASRDPRIAKDPRNRKDFANPRMMYAEPKDARIDPRLGRGADPKPRIDPRLPSVNSNKSNEPRKSRWDPRVSQDESNIPFNTGGQIVSQPPMTEHSSTRHGDPRINRTQQPTQGLLPHPDPRSFQQESGDPRLHLQSQVGPGDPRLQHHQLQQFQQQQQHHHHQHQHQQQQQQQQQSQNFGNQSPFQFGPMNPLNQFNNPFLRGLPQMAPPMINGPAFGWQNNMRNAPPPHMLVAQTLASVQSGLHPRTMINL